MISKAIARFVRISPRKTRLVADLVRGKSIDEAQAILANLEKKARLYVDEVLKSAIANAKNKDPKIDLGDLYVSRITVDGGPMFKRYRAGSMGRAMMVRHRTSHILVELDKKKTAMKPEVKVRSSELGVMSKKIKTQDSRLKSKKLATAKRGK